ncbi:MAG: AhpC/TSA family protein [Flavobacteriaceae bacterium]|nr:AhpC/TSA family protein [Flavobacteriaceae bacterium]
MKNLIAFLSIILLCTACKQEPQLPPNTYQVNVSLPGVYNGIRAHINIISEGGKEITVDTAIVMNETFTLNGTIIAPVRRAISVNGVNGSLTFILEPGYTDISINKDSIKGSLIDGPINNQAHNEYLSDLLTKRKLYKAINSELAIEQSNVNRERYDQLLEEQENLIISMDNHTSDFIVNHPDLQLSLLLLESQIGSRNLNLKLFKSQRKILSNLINRNAENQYVGQKIDTYIYQKESEENLNIGKVAPEFSSPDKDGNMLALKDMKGKATIIDFWAAWCGPCRRENPNVVKIYEKYHDKGLEIIGVSLDGRSNQKDTAKANWLKAIEDDGLNWHHVSSLKYFNDPVARLYRVNAIPATFILDKNGVIVAKKLRGQALEDKIAELLE